MTSSRRWRFFQVCSATVCHGGNGSAGRKTTQYQGKTALCRALGQVGQAKTVILFITFFYMHFIFYLPHLPQIKKDKKNNPQKPWYIKEKWTSRCRVESFFTISVLPQSATKTLCGTCSTTKPIQEQADTRTNRYTNKPIQSGQPLWEP